MTTLDPATGRSLPDSAIQRVLFVAPKLHIYQIPPLTSTKGFSATSWTAPPHPTAQHIFTARVRIIETSLNGTIKTDIVLEDPKTGDLFAAAPYTSPAIVQQALDSSRFFAIRVVGDGGMKATLGVGFEERSDAFDFSITLAEARKVLGFERALAAAPGQAHVRGAASANPAVDEPKKDFSLKEGESITVNIGGRGRRVRADKKDDEADSAALFSIKPPPAPGHDAAPASAPPPPAAHVKADWPPSSVAPAQNQPSAQELGFDDGEFGEFQ